MCTSQQKGQVFSFTSQVTVIRHRVLKLVSSRLIVLSSFSRRSKPLHIVTVVFRRLRPFAHFCVLLRSSRNHHSSPKHPVAPRTSSLLELSGHSGLTKPLE